MWCYWWWWSLLIITYYLGVCRYFIVIINKYLLQLWDIIQDLGLFLLECIVSIHPSIHPSILPPVHASVATCPLDIVVLMFFVFTGELLFCGTHQHWGHQSMYVCSIHIPNELKTSEKSEQVNLQNGVSFTTKKFKCKIGVSFLRRKLRCKLCPGSELINQTYADGRIRTKVWKTVASVLSWASNIWIMGNITTLYWA